MMHEEAILVQQNDAVKPTDRRRKHYVLIDFLMALWHEYSLNCVVLPP